MPSMDNPANDADYQNFLDWFNRLSTAAKVALDYWPWEGPPSYATYQGSRAYKRYQELGPTGITTETRRKAEEAQKKAAAPTTETPTTKSPDDLLGKPPYRIEVKSVGGYDYEYQYDEDGNFLGASRIGPSSKTQTGMTDYEKAQLELQQRQLEEQRRQFNVGEGVSPQEQAQLDFQREQLKQQQMQFEATQRFQQAQMQAEQRYQEQMLAWYREQQANELEAQKQQQLANLRANPQSWLEYASLAGETPAVQPWMVPLSPGDYNMQAGQALPGWTANTESLQSLPQLKTPSAQYLARIPPSARAQYAGYEQARTGATGSDIDWLLGSKVAPPGSGGGLSWVR